MWTEENRPEQPEKQIPELRTKEQPACFPEGIPFVEIVAPATLRKGIRTFTDEEREACIKTWDTYLAGNNRTALFLTHTPAGDAPAGQALIERLGRVDADVVFIGHIGNALPDPLKRPAPYQKALAGMLVNLQENIFGHLRLIESGSYTQEQVEEMIYFLQDELCIKNPEMKYLEDAELILYIRQQLLRPLRVCGMVRNAGGPGGSPFLAKSAKDGVVSLQIVAGSQIDPANPQQQALFEQRAYSGPADMVCALKGPDGRKYHLPDFADSNSAMSDWNTTLVEAPET